MNVLCDLGIIIFCVIYTYMQYKIGTKVGVIIGLIITAFMIIGVATCAKYSYKQKNDKTTEKLIQSGDT